DTGDFETIAEYKPQDATTNPSLLYQAVQKPQYQARVGRALRSTAQVAGNETARIEALMDQLLINFGTAILKIVPGRVPADDDPGVASVTRIYNYFKKFDYKTQVMGASFRNVDQIIHLARCALLTISPDLLQQLEKTTGEVTRRRSGEAARASDATKI